METLTVNKGADVRARALTAAAYRADDRLRDVMRELAALARDANGFVEGFTATNPVEDALRDDVFDVLNAANLAAGAVEVAHDILATLAAY